MNLYRESADHLGVLLLFGIYLSNIKKLITCISNRVYGLLYGENDSLTMLLYEYMPCDKNTDDHIFINVLNTISQLLYKHNPCHIIIGGDINVDFSRSNPNTRVLSDFITDFNLYTCIDLPNTNTPYTFINNNNSTSRIDLFFGFRIIVTLLIIICFLIMFH